MRYDTDDAAMTSAIACYKDGNRGKALQIIRGHFRISLPACNKLLLNKLEEIAKPPSTEEASDKLITEAVSAMDGMDESVALCLEYMKLHGMTAQDMPKLKPMVLARCQEIHAANLALLRMGVNPKRVFRAYAQAVLAGWRDPVTGDKRDEPDPDANEKAYDALDNATKESTLSDDIFRYL